LEPVEQARSRSSCRPKLSHRCESGEGIVDSRPAVRLFGRGRHSAHGHRQAEKWASLGGRRPAGSPSGTPVVAAGLEVDDRRGAGEKNTGPPGQRAGQTTVPNSLGVVHHQVTRPAWRAVPTAQGMGHEAAGPSPCSAATRLAPGWAVWARGSHAHWHHADDAAGAARRCRGDGRPPSRPDTGRTSRRRRYAWKCLLVLVSTASRACRALLSGGQRSCEGDHTVPSNRRRWATRLRSGRLGASALVDGRFWPVRGPGRTRRCRRWRGSRLPSMRNVALWVAPGKQTSPGRPAAKASMTTAAG